MKKFGFGLQKTRATEIKLLSFVAVVTVGIAVGISLLSKTHSTQSRVTNPIVPVIITPIPTITLIPTIDTQKVDQVWTLYNKGFDIWVSTKNYQTARKYYEQALAIDPNFAPALSSLGFFIGAFDNDFEKGKSMIEQAMKVDPTWPYAPYNLGLLYAVHGDDRSGIYWMQYSIDQFPDNPDKEWFQEHLDAARQHSGIYGKVERP